jgi:hypothetical protein
MVSIQGQEEYSFFVEPDGGSGNLIVPGILLIGNCTLNFLVLGYGYTR